MVKYLIKLYVTGETTRSFRAIANLRRVCEEELSGQYELVVIDILERPQLAEDEKILATPTVVKELVEADRLKDESLAMLAPETVPLVFDLFAQADRSLDRAQGGLGIGLTQVRSLVAMHGGTVTCHGEGLGRGSEFVVRLPMADAPVVADPPPLAGSPRERDRSRSLRVLVIDDNVQSAASLALIVKLWGHDTRVVHGGPEALDVAGAYRPEVVLLDIGLPGMDGYTVARHLRATPGLDGALLVAITGYGREEDRQRSRDAGFDHHLVKPLDLDALQSLLLNPGRAS
jgi:CheY-like chemotaxis protein